MANGFRRLAKFGPGSVVQINNLKSLNYFITEELVDIIILEVHKRVYKVYNKATKQIQYLSASYVEEHKQTDLLNLGTVRTLLDDAEVGLDASPPNLTDSPGFRFDRITT